MYFKIIFAKVWKLIDANNLSILLYKVIRFFMSVVRDLANRLTDMVLLYNEASYRSMWGFRLFIFLKVSLGMVLGYFLPSHVLLNIDPLDARDAAASIV